MRTLTELLKVAREAEAAYKARVASAEQEVKAETEAAHEAQADAGAAIARGDKAAYDKALRDDEYHRGRAAMLREQHIKPEFTIEENNAIMDEAFNAYYEGVKPLKNRLCELAEEWNSIAREMNGMHGTVGAISDCLKKARVADWQIERMLPSQRPYNPYKYKGVTMWNGIDKCYFLHGDTLSAIGYTKWKKEKSENE